MTNEPITPAELANLFGVDDCDEVSDDLYADYLEFTAQEGCWACEEGDTDHSHT